MKTLTLESVPDETPETNENFQIVLSNATTTGKHVIHRFQENSKHFACIQSHTLYMPNLFI